MRPRLLLIAAAVLPLAFAPAPLPRPTPRKETSDLRRMQGTWDVVERSLGGRSVLREPTQITIRGTRFQFIVRGEVRSDWIVELGPTESPRRMDRRPFAGGGSGLLGIYRFDGDRLTLCYSQHGARPTQFESSSGAYLMVLRRADR